MGCTHGFVTNSALWLYCWLPWQPNSKAVIRCVHRMRSLCRCIEAATCTNGYMAFVFWCCQHMLRSDISFSVNYALKSNLSRYNDLHACVYIYIRQLSSFRASTLWFIDLTVVTCLIKIHLFWVYANCFSWENHNTWKYLKSAIFTWYENGRWQLLL